MPDIYQTLFQVTGPAALREKAKALLSQVYCVPYYCGGRELMTKMCSMLGGICWESMKQERG